MSSKKKILVSTEYSLLNTGYSVYGRELLTRLYDSNKYEIRELSSYLTPEDYNPYALKWSCYPVVPANGTEERKQFNHQGLDAFGVKIFEQVCLDYQFDICINFRDSWMMPEGDSPYRRYFRWVIMPAVDSRPQKDEWLGMFASADAVLNYEQFGMDLMKEQAGNKINLCGIAPPSAPDNFQPVQDRAQLKQQLGFHPKTNIVGFLSRNQPRKLIAELFQAFKLYLDKTKDKNTVLYCHTSYPDMGYDINTLLKDLGLGSNIFFTYVCNKCHYAFPSLFVDAITFCPRCNQIAAHFSNPTDGVNNDVLCQLYNLFDILVQYSNSEAAGISQIEAGACGTPIMSTDYSAMGSVVRKLNGYPINVISYTMDCPTKTYKARPDDEHFVEILQRFFSMTDEERQNKRIETRRLFEENYSWDKSAETWMNAIDSVSPALPWNSPPRLHQPAQPNDQINNLTNAEYVRWLIIYVLGEPERLGTYFESKIVRDLNWGATVVNNLGGYHNSESFMFSRPIHEQYNRERAYNEMLGLVNRRNYWEQVRCQKLNVY